MRPLIRQKRLAWLVLLVVLATIAASCGGTAETTTTTQAATTTAPSGQTGTTAAMEPGFCSDMHIVFFPGGPEGGPFATVVYNGAVAAQKVLGPQVDYVWSDWDPQKMLTQFQEVVATQPDGIAIMGHPGSDAFGPLVDAAEADGILVTSMNTTLDAIEAKYASAGFGYVGAELYSAGHALGAEAVSRFGLGSGDRAMVWGLLSQVGRGQRTQGVIDALEEAGMTVDYLEIDDQTNADAAAGTPTFVGYYTSHPDVKLVVTDHGALTAAQQTYFEAAGLGPDDVIGAGFDLSSSTVEAIRAGWTDLVIDQQQYLQGFLPILQLCLTYKYAFTGLHIDTGAGFAYKENIELLASLVQEQVR
jgi:simple sugar transport system substrate-binding protein